MTQSGIRILLIEDDEDLREELEFLLSHEGYRVRARSDGSQLEADLGDFVPQLVLLDIGLPGDSGLVLAERLLDRRELGVVMLTARGQTSDRVLGLQSGADAYLVKPVAPSELIATLMAVHRRLVAMAAPAEPSSWRLLEAGWRLVSHDGRSLALTGSERKLLQLLHAAAGKTVSRTQLIAALGHDPYDYDPHALEATVNRLRRKLGASSPLKTVRGVGYAFSAPLLAQ